MFQNFSFNPKTDICEVDQFGFVDTVESEKSGFVRPDLSLTPEAFDGTDVDPEAFYARPSDAFEVMRMQDSLAKNISSQGKSDKE